MPASFGVVDLFAGPGGLGEGFASLDLDGHIPFHIGISVENEHAAHCTLRVRAFQRGYRSRYNRLPEEFLDFHANKITEPEWSDIDRHVWQAAAKEACCLELGTAEAAEAIDGAVTKLHRDYDENILIGGPPCQAYSLVGRVRSRAIIDYVPEDDKRHYLFREYIRVLEKLRPAAFVMENVKGLLSSKLGRHRVYEMLMEDLKSLCTANHHLYEMRAVRVDDSRASLREPEQPSDFIVRAEDFGIPQRRHRVIIIGIRYDLANKSSHASISVDNKRRTVADAIGALPRLRSGISSSSHYGMYSSSMLEWVDFFQNWFVLLEDVATVLDRDPVTAGVRQRFPSAVLASRRTTCAWL